MTEEKTSYGKLLLIASANCQLLPKVSSKLLESESSLTLIFLNHFSNGKMLKK